MLRRILHNFSTRLATAFLSFGIVWLTAHYLGAAGRGDVSLFVTDCALLLLFIGLVGGSSLIYLAPRRNLWHLLLPAYLWSAAVCFIGTALVGMVRQPGWTYFLHLAALSLLQALFSINTSLLLGRRREWFYNLLLVSQAGLLAGGLGLLFTLSAAWHSVTTYYYVAYVAFGIPLILSFGPLLRLPDRRQRMGRRLRATVRELARHSREAHLSNILSFANYRLSYYFVAHYVDVQALGILSVGVALIEAIWLIPRSTALIQYVDLVHSAATGLLPDSALRVARLTLLGTAAAVMALIALPTTAITLIFGDEFSGTHPVMFLLAPGAIVMALHMLISSYFAGIARYKVNNAAALVGLAVTLTACALLIPRFGIQGAAVATSLSYCTSTAFLLFHFSKATHAGLRSFLPRLADLTYFWHLLRGRLG